MYKITVLKKHAQTVIIHANIVVEQFSVNKSTKQLKIGSPFGNPFYNIVAKLFLSVAIIRVPFSLFH